MPGADQIAELFNHLADVAPIGFDLLMGLVGVWGIFLWLFGRRIIRPSFAIAGLLGGAALGALASRGLNIPMLALATIGGAVLGALVLWVTSRVWTALLLAVVLAAAAPWAVLAWHNQSFPIAGQHLKDTAKQLISDGVDSLHNQSGAQGAQEGAAVNNASTASQSASDFAAELLDAFRQTGQQLADWWNNDLLPPTRWAILTVAAAMAFTGLLLGLVMPTLASSLIGSLSGSVLMLLAAFRIATRYLADVTDWLPHTPRLTLIILASVTLIGTILQWTILRPRADKQK
jgi:hypothetical protein